MNQTQLKHVRMRADAIYAKRSKAILEKHTTEPVTLSGPEKLDALKKGNFTVRKTVNGSDWYLSSYITFKGERDRSVDNVGYAKDFAILKADYDKLLDELILGDDHVALELLKAFDV